MVGRAGSRALLLLAAALLGPVTTAAPALIRTPDEASEARAAVKTYAEIKRHTDSLNSLLALGDLAAHDHPVVVDALLDEFETGRVERFRSARRVLESFTNLETLAHLLDRGLEHRDPEVREQVLLALGTSRPEGFDWQSSALAALDDAAPRVRAAAVEALAQARVAAALPQMLELATDESVRVRQVIPGSLVRLAPQRAYSLLRSMRHDQSWRVRVAAARALGDVRSLRSVELLVDMLEHERGRVREDALLVLQQLTGQDYGVHVAAWRRFLETAPKDFLSMTGGGQEQQGAILPATQVYYGLRSFSRRLLLITDLSGSMSTRETSGYRNREPATRLEMTQAEMRLLIDSLEDDVALNLVTFTDRVNVWSKQLVPMTERNRQRARTFIDGYRADGATNVYQALVTAYDMAERSLDHPKWEEQGPDTVFLLTDGTPSEGALRDLNLLLQYIGERNRSVQLRIHCIALTQEASSREFMRRIARLTGGQYVNPLD